MDMKRFIIYQYAFTNNSVYASLLQDDIPVIKLLYNYCCELSLWSIEPQTVSLSL